MPPSKSFFLRHALLLALFAGLMAAPAQAMYYHCRNADGSDTYVHHQCAAGQQLLGMSAYLPGHEPPPPKAVPAAAPKHATAAVDATTDSTDGHTNVVYGGFHPDSGGAAAGQGGAGGGQGNWSSGDPTTPRAYTGDNGSWLKQLFVKVYGKRCSDSVQRTRIMSQWSPADAETFCHCVGANVYESSMNYDGIKQAISSHGQSLEGAANSAGEQCVNGPSVPKWQASN